MTTPLKEMTMMNLIIVKKEDTSNRVASDRWNPWKPLKTPEMVDTPEKVLETSWKLGLLKLAVRNNDIESQKNLACFQTYRTVVCKGELSVYKDVLESRKIGRAFKLVNPKHEDQASVRNANSLSLN